MKIRFEGTDSEISMALEELKAAARNTGSWEIISVSKPYQNRGCDTRMRVYVEAQKLYGTRG